MKYILDTKDIETIIDHFISRDNQVCFVCNEELAGLIQEYVYDDHGLYDDDIECDCQELYVSILPTSHIDMRFIVENAFGFSGRYKENDVGECTYYIFTDMPEEEIKRCFPEGEVYHCEFEQEKLTCKDCICCAECEEEEIISELLEFVFEGDSCVDCKARKIIDTLYKFKNRGEREG